MARHALSGAPGSQVSRTRRAVPSALSGSSVARRVAGMAGELADERVGLAPPGTEPAATTSATGSSSSRVPRCSRKRRLASSARSTSSTVSSSGPRAASLAQRRKTPWSTSKDGSMERGPASKSGRACRAEPLSRLARSSSPARASLASKS